MNTDPIIQYLYLSPLRNFTSERMCICICLYIPFSLSPSLSFHSEKPHLCSRHVARSAGLLVSIENVMQLFTSRASLCYAYAIYTAKTP